MKRKLLVAAGTVIVAIGIAVLLGSNGDRDSLRVPISPVFTTATANFVRVAQTATAMAPQVTPDLTPWPTPTPLPPDASHIAQATATASVQRAKRFPAVPGAPGIPSAGVT